MSDFNHIIDTAAIPDGMTAEDYIEMMKKTAMLPVSTSNSTTVTQTSVIGEQYLMLEFAGDLLSCGEISPKEWHSIKMLLKSNSEENWKLVQNILKARGYGNV